MKRAPFLTAIAVGFILTYSLKAISFPEEPQNENQPCSISLLSGLSKKFSVKLKKVIRFYGEDPAAIDINIKRYFPQATGPQSVWVDLETAWDHSVTFGANLDGFKLALHASVAPVTGQLFLVPKDDIEVVNGYRYPVTFDFENDRLLMHIPDTNFEIEKARRAVLFGVGCALLENIRSSFGHNHRIFPSLMNMGFPRIGKPTKSQILFHDVTELRQDAIRHLKAITIEVFAKLWASAFAFRAHPSFWNIGDTLLGIHSELKLSAATILKLLQRNGSDVRKLRYFGEIGLSVAQAELNEAIRNYVPEINSKLAGPAAIENPPSTKLNEAIAYLRDLRDTYTKAMTPETTASVTPLLDAKIAGSTSRAWEQWLSNDEQIIDPSPLFNRREKKEFDK